MNVETGPVASDTMNPVGTASAMAWRISLARLDKALLRLIELAVAALIIVETLVLLAGVIARYAFRRPLIWSDDLASLLFMWLIMLGTVVALKRGAHLRLTVLLNANLPRVKPRLEATAVVVSAAFILALLQPAYEYTLDEALIITPGLGISNAWRVAALPAGVLLMLAVLVTGAAGRLSPARLIAVSCLVLLIGIALWSAAPLLSAIGNYNLLIFFVALVSLCVALGVPIAFSFGIATVAYLACMTHIPLSVVVSRMQEGMSHLILLSVPLFVFLGLLIEMTGMARAMVAFLASLLGHVRGGLHYVLVGAMYLVSGISGSKAADMAAVAPVLFPEMKQRGARPGDLVALLAATGAQTETIPPSLVLITIGSVTGVSISALFTGGLLPGVVLAITLSTLVWWRYRREDLSHVKRASASEVGRTFVIALPALALPFVIRYAVVEGIATATEVSTIGIVYGFLVGLLIYRRFDWRRLLPMLIETACLSGAILMIIGTATGMAWGLTQSGFSRALATAMTGLPGGAATFIAVSILAFIVLGSVLEGIPAIVLFGPLLFPIARAVGVHEVHYAMVIILAMGIGLFAPPFGVGYYAACAIGRVDPAQGIRPIWGYLLALLIGLVIVAVFPWISIGFL